MKLVDLKVLDFLNEVDSKSPAPGGGSVSALVSSLGVSLTRMVGHLTTSKKKFASLEAEIQLEFQDVMSALDMIKQQLILSIDEDTKAFNQIMAAYQLPKDNEENQKIRYQAIQLATEEAIIVPLKVAALSFSVLHHLPFMIQYGNPQAISDLGVAMLSLATGIEGACMNVLINLPGFDNKIAASQYKKQVDQLIDDTHRIRDEVLSLIYQSLKKDES